MIRPKDSDDDVIALALDDLLPRVMRWLRDGGDQPPPPEDEVRADIAEHFFADDGFDFCDKLKHEKHWECDSALVDILDGAPYALINALREQTKKWVTAYQVYCAHVIGDIVLYRGHECEITKIDAEEGRYWLFDPAVGHVCEGLGTHAHIVNWEVVDGTVNARGLRITGPLLEASGV